MGETGKDRQTRCVRVWEWFGHVTRLTITRKDGREYKILIDTADTPRIKDYRWNIGGDERPYTMIDGSYTSMHRLIMNAKKGENIDHINHDYLDNRKSNLRFCTHKENLKNKLPSKNARVPYKGVFKRRFTGEDRYRVKICVDGKVKSLGTFGCPIKAAKAYDKAAIELHGEFACTNKSLGLIE